MTNYNRATVTQDNTINQIMTRSHNIILTAQRRESDYVFSGAREKKKLA
jgi:hypothetical protein